MKRNNYLKTGRLLLLAGMFSVVSVIMGGCTKQSYAGCPEEVELRIRVADTEGEDITNEGCVRGVMLYVFDEDKRFLKLLNAEVDKPLRLYFPDQETLHVISWGNLTGERAHLPALTTGASIHEAMIRLLNAPRTEGKAVGTRPIAISPDDLFYAYNEIPLIDKSQTTFTMRLSRSVSSIAVTMRNLQSYANRYDDNYSLVVRETHNTIDFFTRLSGDKVGYVPASSFNEKKELIAHPINLLPSLAEDAIEIDVYHDGQLITTVKKDSQGRFLKTEKGKLLNVLVDFRLNVEVEVSVTPWGVVQVWKEY